MCHGVLCAFPSVAVGDSGVVRALRRLLLKRKAGLESHLRDVANLSVEIEREDTTIRCRKVCFDLVVG